MGAGDRTGEGKRGLDAEAWRRRALVVWTVVGCCVVAALAVRVLGLVWPAVELVVVGVVIGFICSPITNALERHGVPRAAVVSGPRHEHSLTVMLAVLSRSMGGYMRSILFTSLICGALSFLGLAAVGHPYAGLMGIVICVFHFVPVIGAWVSAAMATLLALFVSPLLAVETAVITVVAMNVTDNVISPLVMRSAVNVHPALSLLGIVVGNALGGVFGMVLAIPLTAAIRSVFVYYFELRSGRQLVSYDGALFRSTPFHGEDGSIEPSFDALDDDKFFEDTLLVRPGSAPQVEPATRPEGVRMSLRDEISHRIRYGIAAAPGRIRASGRAAGGRSASIGRAGADPEGAAAAQELKDTSRPKGTSDRGDQ
ncbi:MAG: AI-2E family transporter [Olsenella sp.]|jgi:hypothetical protein